MVSFADVTELAGDEVSQEQVARVCTRYGWAARYCQGKDVLEVACGTGPGLGLLAATSRTFTAGDISEVILARGRSHYGARLDIRVLSAEALPFNDQSLDVVILFEALYYVPNAEQFVRECKRVLRPNGHVLISNANKDLPDFNPSPYSTVYHGVVELGGLFTAAGFNAEFFGDIPVTSLSWRQKIFRPIKRIVVALNLMPRSMAGKKLLKRLVFGEMSRFPAEITPAMAAASNAPRSVRGDVPDQTHKVILCAARRIAT
jgi:SAM-dependent methyltransferase